MRASGYLLLAVAIVGASTGCGDSKAEERRPELRAEFAEDGSGAADWLIDFGDVPLGSTGMEEVGLRNLGATTLRLQSSQLDAPFFVEGLGEGLELAPGGSMSLHFRFRPVEAGQEQTVLTIFSNEEGGGVERSLRLVGGGVVPALRCTPGAIDFAQVPRGASRTQKTVCTNPLALALELSALEARGHFAQSFRARATRGVTLPAQLPPGEAVELEIEILADTLGANQAALALLDGEGGVLAELRMSAEVVVSALEIEPSTCLDFGYVAEGERRIETLRLKSKGPGPIEVRELRFLGDGQGAFTVETALPLLVPTGDEPPAELHVAFEPPRLGQVAEDLELLITDELDGSGSVKVCMSGFGGGPRLRCEEEKIDFGMVAMDEPIHRRLHCSNQGAAPGGMPIDPVFLSEVSTDHPAFSATLLGPDGAAGGPRPGGYAVGEGFDVEILFSPSEEAIASGELLLRTNGAPSGIYAVSLVGDGRRHLPCSLSIDADALRFGTIDRGSLVTRRVRIENLLPSSCWIEAVQLSEGSDPSFSVEAAHGLSLEGFGERWIEVSFAPERFKERFEGQVELRFLGSDSPSFIALSGRSARPCLVVEPSPLDFGSTIPGCSSRTISASIRNVCEASVSLLAIGLEGEEGASPFRVDELPALPQEIQANATLEASFRFLPTSAGVEEGAFSMTVDAGVGDRDIYVSGLRGVGADGLQTDRFSRDARAKVDVLWVLDNTPPGSTVWRRMLETNLSAILSVAERENVDFRMAMTTSGLTPRGSSCPGGARGGEDGRFFPIDGSSPRILNSSTPDLEQAWATNINVGTCNNWREYYEAAHRALSEPLISVDKDPRYQDENDYRDGNAGFLRPDAFLSIIFVAPGSDNSGIYGKTPAGYLASFRSVKGGDPDRLRVHAITGRSSTDSDTIGGGCLSSGQVSDRLMVSVTGTDGVWLDICLPAWDVTRWTAGLERLSEAVFADTRRLPLRGWPADQDQDGLIDEADLLVEVDGEVIPAIDPLTGSQRWFFDPVMNEIGFAKGANPRADAEIAVTYRLGCAGSR